LPSAKPIRALVLAALLPGLAPASDRDRPASAAGPSARPNVIFILADDLGWADTTLYGHTKFHRTPHLERLAQRGMTFTRAYSASPLCSPTRASILTGLSPARTGITAPNCHLPQVRLEAVPGTSAPPHQHAIPPETVTRLKPDYPTLPQALKAAGYATGHFGKWHLGAEPYSPLDHGFDVDIPHHPGPGPAGSFVAPWKFKDFRERSPGEHLEDRMAAEAVAWMERHQDRPFFLNYWQFSVHAPFDAKKERIEAARARLDPRDAQRSPTYAAMVESLDDAVGTLLDALDRLRLADRTIILFTSDNGGNMYNEVDGTTPTSNRPLRGGKATLFEGGTRVPQIIAWPGLTAPGSRSEALTQSEDFFPTLIEGLALQTAPGQTFDGVSLLPALRGEPLDRPAVFQYFPHSPGVPDWLPPGVSVHRQDGWKLIRLFHAGTGGAHRHLLFHLTEDPGEKTDLAARRTDLVPELDALIEDFLGRTRAVVPVPNPAFDPARHHPELEGVPTRRKAASPPTAASPEAAPASGWQSGPGARLHVGDGELRITSTGGDPWISTRGLPRGAKGPFTLRLRLRSTGAGRGVVFFGTPANPGFHAERSVSFAMPHDGQPHPHEVALPTESITALRLDPGNAPGETVITLLALLDAAGTVVRSWLPSPGS
jgi:arylsulfatase A-like enzyme